MAYIYEKEMLDGERRIHLNHISVLPDFQNKGYAKLLLKEIELYAINKNIQAIDLDVSLANNKALNLYKNIGYKVERESLIKLIE